jgi:GNAT superfamily N-acetyltransferase
MNTRWATEDDFGAIRNLANQLATHLEDPEPPLDFARFQSFFLSAGAPMKLLLAVDSNRVVGFASWAVVYELYSGQARVFMSDLVVDASARGKGVGTELMNAVVAWAKANGATKVGWEVWRGNETAKAFYQKFGGSIDEEAYPYMIEIPAGASDANNLRLPTL